jgi:L,D-transpeptidase ErfK/SrfK
LSRAASEGLSFRHRAIVGLATLIAGVVLLSGAAVCGPAELRTDALNPGTPSTYISKPQENLLDIAQLFDVGYTELVAANPGIDPWLTPVGSRVRIPSYYILPDDVARHGIVINLAAQRLFWFTDDGRLETYPIGIGEVGHTTPAGVTQVTAKQVNPAWYPPKSIRARKPELPRRVPPGPDNPLGAFALRLGWPEYLIHGTNVPDTIGRDASNGCIRLYPEDIAALFPQVPVGTPVQVVTQDVVATRINGNLIIEVYPNEAQAHDLNVHGHFTPEAPPDLEERVRKLTEGRKAKIDWAAVEKAGLERTGLPVRVAVFSDKH